MSDHLYISSSCIIDNRRVFKNGGLLLEGDVSASEWLRLIYSHLHFDYPKFYKMDNLSKLGWLSTELLLEKGAQKKYQPQDIGIVLCNRSSSMDTDIKYFETVKTMASPALFVYTLPNIVIGEISIRHQIKGENMLFISERFETGFIRQYVQQLFSINSVHSCICGWLEYLDNKAEAALYFVERSPNGESLEFTEENINKLYQLING